MESSKTHQEDPMLDVDFSGLILGFSSAALYYLGASGIEGKGPAEINLPLAKQNIRIIEMLLEKTKGNLSKEESSLLDQMLKDLHLKYNSIQMERKT